ncbi:hypothetical protein KK083_07370 [Fulvivirgaceae bacterium PWU4]|uniref:Uncharacterized protein n=1 Tax=Chryseosolibacter histidini TaxID=2782349 RepID=A0AAP2DKJ9_9BACT|nr:hypothetical protein [Chryseosolibacter histidini]MBT1696687.1 hypothetical protein [Chryseosolibacter histidini]
MSTPKDDEYWFELGAGLVSGAITKLETTATQLKDLSVWLWGIYAAATITTSVFVHLTCWHWLFFALPYLLLIASHVYASNALFPENIEFDYKAPGSIKTTYVAALASKKKNLDVARTIISATAAYVAIVLIASFIYSNYHAPRTDSFDGLLVKNKRGATLVITGNIGKNKAIVLKVQSFKEHKTKAAAADTLYMLTGNDGYFSTSIKVDSLAASHAATVEWKEEEYKKMLVKEFKQ